MSTELEVMAPELAAAVEHAIAERLHETFKGDTDVDLDALAKAITADLVGPRILRGYERRDDMFMSAVNAVCNYRDETTEELQRRLDVAEGVIRHVEEERDRWMFAARRSAAASRLPDTPQPETETP